MIEVRKLTKKYGSNFAVKQLSFTITDNQVFGLLGPNGAGKSTVMNIMTGCLSATSGQVIINGFDMVKEPKKAKRNIGYLPELPPLYQELTPYEYLRFVAEVKQIASSRINNEIETVMRKTQIEDMSRRLIRNLSKGYRQRVGIAQALLGDPPIIILDEPTVGLDPRQIIDVRELIHALGRDHIVILSSHILSEITSVCSEVMIISHGELVTIDKPEHLSDSLVRTRELLITVRVADAEIARSALLALEGTISVLLSLPKDDGTVAVSVNGQVPDWSRDKVAIALLDAHCPVLSMQENLISLEDVFLKLTENS